MRVDDFDFDLPEDLIALRPARPRSASRLLHAVGDEIADSGFADLPGLLRNGDLLVFNDTEVIPARLSGIRRRFTQDGSGEARIEATLISRAAPDAWRALVRPSKRLRPGDMIVFGGKLSAEVAGKGEEGEVLLRFAVSGPDLDAAIAGAGAMPLPPYIEARRPSDDLDRSDYQTMFARRPGAVAAPTASLHFDDGLMENLRAAGVRDTRLTLHVGAGTFLPVKSALLADHKMHSEWGEIGQDAVDAILAAKAAGGRVIPVGTTALRLLESAARGGALAPFRGDTDIFITPGYRFQVADGLITNFHLPRSTLMMLVSALMGTDRIRAIYAHAVAQRYRFYSYGDGSLLLPLG
ncbi:MAG: S-adenosylmethionine:tRNA ribosyltransferase-isomerase [Paracoccaceae bacterium]|jgi:S-adenosylmethionine:tRNA ribosyltransferase-isomerase